MYPASSSSSSHRSSAAANHNHNLLRYGSAPSSLFAAAVDSVVHLGIGSTNTGTYSSSIPSTTMTTTHCFSAINDYAAANEHHHPPPRPNQGGFDGGRSFGGVDLGRSGEVVGVSNSNAGNYAAPPPLLRTSSSPAGLLNRLASDIGFAVTKGFENCSTNNGHKLSRLSSQLSFTKGESLPHISEARENVHDNTSSRRGSQSSPMAGFSLGPWDNGNSIMFNPPPSKRAKHINGDNRSDYTTMESQYSLAHTALDLAGMEHLMHIPEDSVPCKVRAKRGCATHPRSIAERERRTRISGKLKKLQELVPNMDKQTSYADMLDLAVQHIKGLQTQIQQLNKEQEHCKCGSKQTTQR
ncbi:Transcription factor bHLH128-like protein [Drosera capensis]